MPRVELEGKVALVTGGGRRVGAAIARALARAGCDLAVHHATSAEGAAQVVADAVALGRRATALKADLVERGELDALARSALAWSGGRLDVLVHAAANFERVPPDELSAEAWDRALALNATAPYLLTMALAAPLRAGRGAVVMIGCVSATRPWKNYLPYSVSKAAVTHLARELALVLAPEVRVNTVAPGTVLPPDDYDAEKRERLAAKLPLRRLGEADDVARAVVFLAQNDFVTGQVLAVDGGAEVG